MNTMSVSEVPWVLLQYLVFFLPAFGHLAVLLFAKSGFFYCVSLVPMEGVELVDFWRGLPFLFLELMVSFVLLIT
jgi:hypothetical protein